ncbi:hypothetical protein DRF60_09730 [Chryseobacterium elymi]|uniref:Uncharacterized protein n=1 Tax=Chryseobacterium elymi TaxID=395936 RepID=A0A3D9DJC5_9FLAO|nr:hypothetical protein [Chryseobacterium elymi]REC77941.1 hypothetical protein DRF60_09730 [Chryseobacterium elymi]
MKKNYINLIYYTLDEEFTKVVNNYILREKKTIIPYSKKYNSSNYKVRTYDKVCTPFLNTQLFNHE